nr:uncharacterized protein LOC107794690 [Ipomoea trifida]
MAKLSVAILFLLFTISVARSPLTKPENDVTVNQLSDSVTKSDAGDAIRLPSESNREETDAIEAETKAIVAEVTPLNLVRFRPVNRRFRFRSTLPFRRCHHRFGNGHKHRLVVRSGGQIPYGDDMILSSPKTQNLGDVTIHSDVRQVPPELIPFLHRHGHYRHRGDGEEKLAKYASKRYHRSESSDREKNYSFGKRIRKFLKQYFD